MTALAFEGREPRRILYPKGERKNSVLQKMSSRVAEVQDAVRNGIIDAYFFLLDAQNLLTDSARSVPPAISTLQDRARNACIDACFFPSTTKHRVHTSIQAYVQRCLAPIMEKLKEGEMMADFFCYVSTQESLSGRDYIKWYRGSLNGLYLEFTDEYLSLKTMQLILMGRSEEEKIQFCSRLRKEAPSSLENMPSEEQIFKYLFRSQTNESIIRSLRIEEMVYLSFDANLESIIRQEVHRRGQKSIDQFRELSYGLLSKLRAQGRFRTQNSTK